MGLDKPVRTAADCLRNIADKLDQGEHEEDWAPFVWLLAKAMMRRREKP